jgi:hypothetical protein
VGTSQHEVIYVLQKHFCSTKRARYGYQESFFSGFKVDLGDPGRFETAGQLIEAIHLQLYVYNRYRIHLSLKMAPKQYLAKRLAPALKAA